MALVLGLKQGESFYVDDLKVEIARILTPEKFIVLIHGPVINKVTVTPDSHTELMHGVRLCAGENKYISAIRAVIQAPSSRKILREKLYHADRAGK